mgnify:CR=1 FL=1
MKLNLSNCEIGNISTTKDKGVKITLYTPELSAVDMALIFEAQKKGIADEIDVDYTQEGKTPSERLRNVLYCLFMEKKTAEIFDDFYRREVEKMIDSVKAQLPKL